MNLSLLRILSDLKTENLADKSSAITDLALLLEMHSYELNYNQRISKYSSFLDQDLIEIILDKNEQYEIIESLKSLILCQDNLNASLIWAIGKSTPDLGLTALLEIINNSLNFSDDELYELLISLGNVLFDGGSFSLCEQIKQDISQSNLVLFLENSRPISDRTHTSLCGLLALLKESVGTNNLENY